MHSWMKSPRVQVKMMCPMCSGVGGGGRVTVPRAVGRGLSDTSLLAMLRGADGISRQSEIAIATRINPSGKCIPRGLVRRLKIRRRDIISLILHRFESGKGTRQDNEQ